MCIRDSLWTQWYDDTLKQYEGYFLGGVKDGDWVEWDEFGNINVNLKYVDGKKWTGRYNDIFYLKVL